MFRTLVYFDNKKVTEYKSLIQGKKAVELRNVKISNEKGGKAKLSILSGEIVGKSEMDGEIIENFLLDCKEFESLLIDRDDYFDFIENPDFDIEKIPRSSIIRFDGTFNIPEEFDMMDLINQFKSMLINSIDTTSKEESEMLHNLLGKESTKIPIFIEADQTFTDRLGFSKINSNYLCCDIESLDEFENENVTIIAKLISKKDVNSGSFIVYDVMKDLFSLNRAMRRQLADNKIEDINNISIDENFMMLEILAIYQ